MLLADMDSRMPHAPLCNRRLRPGGAAAGRRASPGSHLQHPWHRQLAAPSRTRTTNTEWNDQIGDRYDRRSAFYHGRWRHRHVIECYPKFLKEDQAIVTCYENLAVRYQATSSSACFRSPSRCP